MSHRKLLPFTTYSHPDNLPWPLGCVSHWQNWFSNPTAACSRSVIPPHCGSPPLCPQSDVTTCLLAFPFQISNPTSEPLPSDPWMSTTSCAMRQASPPCPTTAPGPEWCACWRVGPARFHLPYRAAVRWPWPSSYCLRSCSYCCPQTLSQVCLCGGMAFIAHVNNSFINTIKATKIVNTLFLDDSVYRSPYFLKKQTNYFCWR